MTEEQQDSRATWQNPDPASWDPPPVLPDLYDSSSPQEEQVFISPESERDVDEPEDPAFFSRDGLRRFARQFSPVLVPLPFALLIFLFTLPAIIKDVSHLQALPLVLFLVALVVLQGTLLYYAGSNDGLWMLYTIGGYLLFVFVGAFALFGFTGLFFLLIFLVVIGGFLFRRSFHQVPEGYVDIAFIFGKYSRTLFPGLNFTLPWEKAEKRLSTQLITWTTNPPVRVNIARDQDVELIATISYQLLPEDAYIVALNIPNWQEMVHTQFLGTLKSVMSELSLADFAAWSHALTNIDVTDPTTKTRWDRINEALERRLQDQVAAQGVLVHRVQLQDITFIPLLSTASTPPLGIAARAPVQRAAHGAAPGSPPVERKSTPSAVSPTADTIAQPQPVTRAAESSQAQQVSLAAGGDVERRQSAPPASGPVTEQALIEAYNAVRLGRITDPEVILDFARRFQDIANDPQASQHFPYDAARAARNLIECATKYSKPGPPRAASQSAAPLRPQHLAPSDSLTTGG